MRKKIIKFLVIIFIAEFLNANGVLLASDSKNYKILEDSVDFGKTQGGADRFLIKDKADKYSVGLASLGTISLRPASFQMFFAIAVFSAVSFFYFLSFAKRKKLQKDGE